MKSVYACTLKRVTRRREELRGVVRKLLENNTVQGKRDGLGTLEPACHGGALHTSTPRDYAPVCLPYM
ncbi:hypothetical protein T4B_9459 [Trichinella pseudospiralis]|uniref:Uncharacterized protein n=1 Tax=Trichinella pseudospiralis TaxID=6337 RepID=A0A0V1IJT4_TRIPS|nr:hypothetical protein T4A_5653 [Trichinella pseudospiralis]KRZ23046.1 hypothetical protein T4B_9459 [Trichinella pseudospiralis]